MDIAPELDGGEEMIETFYQVKYSLKGKWNDPRKRLNEDGSYKEKFENQMLANFIPFVPLEVTKAEIKLLEAQTDTDYDSALRNIVFCWRCYIERQSLVRKKR